MTNLRMSSRRGSVLVAPRGLALVAGGAVSLAAAASAGAANFMWLLPNSGGWNTAANWSPFGVPLSAGDTVLIDATGAAYTVTLDVNPTLDAFTLNSADATLFASGRTMAVTGASTISAGTLRLQSSSWLGSGLLTNAASVIVEGAVTISNLSNAAGGTLTVRGVPGLNSGLTVTTPFTNSGAMVFTSTTNATANLAVGGTGVFTNAATGTVTVQAGAGGGRTLDAQVENAGAFTVSGDAGLSRLNGVHKNTGTFTVDASRTLSMSGTNQRFEQNAGTLDVNGAFEISGATFRLSGGAITGAGLVRVTNGRLEMGGGGSGTVALRGTNTMSGSIVSGQTVLVRGEPGLNTGVTADAGFSNVGTLTFTSTTNAAANMTVGGSGTLSNFGSLNILAGAGGQRQYDWNLVNQAAGTVEIDAGTVFAGAGRNHSTSGLFHIAGTGSLTISGANQTFTLNNGTLDVDGLLDVVGATFVFNGGTLTGDGTARVTNGRLSLGTNGTGTIISRGTGTMAGNIKANQSVLVRGEPGLNTGITADASFSNAGTLTFTSTTNSTSNMTVNNGGGLSNSGTLNIEAGSGGQRLYNWNLSNEPSGTVNINAAATFTGTNRSHASAGAFNVSSGNALTIDNGNQTFTLAAGTLNVNGLLDAVSSTLTFNGGAVTGTGTVRATNGRITFGAGSTSTGAVVSRGSGTMAGDIPAGMSVIVRGEPGLNTSVGADDSFTNAGVLTFTSTTNASSNMTVNGAGTLTNTGSLSILTGSGGQRMYNWNLSNAAAGTVTVGADAVFAGAGRVHTNSGTFAVPAGSSLTVSANGQTFSQDAGTLNVDGLLDAVSSTFRLSGGAITGAGTVRTTNGRLELGNLPGGAGAVLQRGSGTMSGNVRAGQTIIVRGEPGLNTSITADDSFSNAGTLVFTSTTFATSNMTVGGAGSLTNSGFIDFLAGSGGQRLYNWNFDNTVTGNVGVNADVVFAGTARAHANSGLFQVSAGRSLSINGGGQTFAMNGGTLTTDGLFDTVGATFAFNGGTITGAGTTRVTNGRLAHGAGGTGTVVVRGGSTMGGDIPAGHTTIIRGEPGLNTSVTADAAFTNAGVIDLTSTTFATANLSVGGTGVLTNTGTFNILSGAGGQRLLNAALTNSGVVESNAAASIGLAGANHSNTGVLRVAANTLTITGATVTNTGTGSVQGNGALNVAAFGATGLTNGAALDPGLGFTGNDAASIGALTLQGNLSQQAAGSLRVNLAGLAGGQFDVLTVTGAANLAGDVRVALAPGFFPQVGDAWRVMNFGSRAGAFTGATLAIGPSGYTFGLEYNSGFMNLVVTAVPAPGAAWALGAVGVFAMRRRRGL